MYDQYQGKKYFVTKICSQMASGTATMEYHKLRITMYWRQLFLLVVLIKQLPLKKKYFLSPQYLLNLKGNSKTIFIIWP